MIASFSEAKPLIVVAGPSGAGKTTVASRLVDRDKRFSFSISASTRSPRGNEVDGVDYLFLSQDEFATMVSNGDFVEWAEVHGEKYGTPRDQLDSAFRSETSLVLDIDVQGAIQIKNQIEDVTLIFLMPPSVEVLVERLRGRGTEKEEKLIERLQNAREEVVLAKEFDYMLVNEELDRVFAQIKEIITVERETNPKGIDLSSEIRQFQTGLDIVLEDLLE